MFRNVATKIAVFAFTTTDGTPKTGDAANLTAYVSKDYGVVTVLADITATELDATNAKGWYLFDVAQAETNADALLFSGKSSTANISVVAQYIHTAPNRFTTMVIDAAGLVDANMVKAGPTGAGTAQTAGDIMADTNDIQTRLPAALVSGRMDSSVGAMAIGVLTATAIAADAITDAKVAADVTIASVTGSVGSVTGLTAANLDVAVSTRMAAYAQPTGFLAATFQVGTVANTTDIPTATANADAMLNRDMSAVSDTTARSPLNALRFLRNLWSISGTTLTVKKEDDITTAWTSVVTPAPGADPISGSDPA